MTSYYAWARETTKKLTMMTPKRESKGGERRLWKGQEGWQLAAHALFWHKYQQGRKNSGSWCLVGPPLLIKYLEESTAVDDVILQLAAA